MVLNLCRLVLSVPPSVLTLEQFQLRVQVCIRGIQTQPRQRGRAFGAFGLTGFGGHLQQDVDGDAQQAPPPAAQVRQDDGQGPVAQEQLSPLLAPQVVVETVQRLRQDVRCSREESETQQ